MFKQLAISVITASVIFNPTAVLADHEPTTSNTDEHKTETKEAIQLKRQEIKSNIQQKREEVRSNIEEKRQEIESKIEERREEIKLKFQQKRTEVAKAVIERQTKHADNLNKIITRIQTKTTELESAGKDVSAIQTEITNAQNYLAQALIGITTSTDILNSISQDNISNQFSTLKDSIRKTHQDLVATQQALRKSINEAKKISDPKEKDDTERSKIEQ